MSVKVPVMPAPPASELRALANHFGHPLPESYVLFVEKHDGAELEDCALTTLDNLVGVRRFIPVAEAADYADEIDGFPLNVIPFAEDDCGNYFYVRLHDGAVFFWDHELDDPDELVAADASAFQVALQPFQTETVRPISGPVKRSWFDRFFRS